jgi:ABC transporter substrate binding protein
MRSLWLSKPTPTSTIPPPRTGKQLQLLKEIVPGMMRIAAVVNPDDPNSQTLMQGVPMNAERLGLAVMMLEVSTPTAIEHAFTRLQHERCDGLWISASPVTVGNRARIVSLAATAKLPAIYPFRDFAIDGGLMSYGTDYTENFRRAAAFVDKIFRGANPDDLPVEQPTKFELVSISKPRRPSISIYHLCCSYKLTRLSNRIGNGFSRGNGARRLDLIRRIVRRFFRWQRGHQAASAGQRKPGPLRHDGLVSLSSAAAASARAILLGPVCSGIGGVRRIVIAGNLPRDDALEQRELRPRTVLPENLREM